MTGQDISELLDSLPEGWEKESRDRLGGMLGVTIVNWRTLQADAAPETWERLADWVDWFTDRYQIPQRKIPACWYQHPALVEELSALHTAWTVSFDSVDAGYGPIGWHERLAAALPRMATWYNGECHNGHTTPHTTPQPGHGSDPSWAEWVRSPHDGTGARAEAHEI
ncbi:MAG: hypothetical protein ACTHJI_02140 [Leifsonia sp.]